MNRTNTFALLLATLALTLGLAACGSGGDTTATSTEPSTGTESSSASGGAETGSAAAEESEAEARVPTIVVKNGEPVGGIVKLEYSAGEQIRFKVKGDEAEEIHVHGYDLMEDIPQGGGKVEFDFPAEIEGIFEAELEGKGVQILELRVNP